LSKFLFGSFCLGIKLFRSRVYFIFILVFGLTKEIDLLENFKGERKLPIDRDSIHEKSLYWYQRVLFDERSSIELFFGFLLA
jgi:hypothetical protein